MEHFSRSTKFEDVEATIGREALEDLNLMKVLVIGMKGVSLTLYILDWS
jgi:tRNA A37 threonylcarbamoyladenosine dehydratase